jgi:hypothetical protein
MVARLVLGPESTSLTIRTGSLCRIARFCQSKLCERLPIGDFLIGIWLAPRLDHQEAASFTREVGCESHCAVDRGSRNSLDLVGDRRANRLGHVGTGFVITRPIAFFVAPTFEFPIRSRIVGLLKELSPAHTDPSLFVIPTYSGLAAVRSFNTPRVHALLRRRQRRSPPAKHTAPPRSALQPVTVPSSPW